MTENDVLVSQMAALHKKVQNTSLTECEQDVRLLMQGGVRRAARSLAKAGAAAVGIAGVTALVVGGLAPLISGGFTAAVLAELLKSFGGNALAGWLGNISVDAIRQARSSTPLTQEAGLAMIARDLEVHLAQNTALADDLVGLIQRLDVIGTALRALEIQIDAQTDVLIDVADQVAAQNRLLHLLQSDLRRSDLIQGKLHNLVVREISAGTSRILASLTTLQVGQDYLAGDVTLVLVSLQAMQAEMQRMIVQMQRHPEVPQPSASTPVDLQTGGIQNRGTISSIGTQVGGDYVASDKVQGNKHVIDARGSQGFIHQASDVKQDFSHRTINTGGGDYAEGDIHKQSYTAPVQSGMPITQALQAMQSAMSSSEVRSNDDLLDELRIVESNLKAALRAEESRDHARRGAKIAAAQAAITDIVTNNEQLRSLQACVNSL